MGYDPDNLPPATPFGAGPTLDELNINTAKPQVSQAAMSDPNVKVFSHLPAAV